MAASGETPEAREGLLEQVHFLTARLLECREQRAMFEAAAAERLAVIEDGAREIARRDARMADLEGVAARREELDAARAEVAATRERLREAEGRLAAALAELEEARLESARGMRELAARERTLVEENRMWREEGLLESLRRRVGNLFS